MRGIDVDARVDHVVGAREGEPLLTLGQREDALERVEAALLEPVELVGEELRRECHGDAETLGDEVPVFHGHTHGLSALVGEAERRVVAEGADLQRALLRQPVLLGCRERARRRGRRDRRGGRRGRAGRCGTCRPQAPSAAAARMHASRTLRLAQPDDVSGLVVHVVSTLPPVGALDVEQRGGRPLGRHGSLHVTLITYACRRMAGSDGRRRARAPRRQSGRKSRRLPRRRRGDPLLEAQEHRCRHPEPLPRLLDVEIGALHLLTVLAEVAGGESAPHPGRAAALMGRSRCDT